MSPSNDRTESTKSVLINLEYKTFYQGRDILACSKTGSGKTAAFALPILEKLAEDPYGVFGVVLTPTRELALQISEQFKLFGKGVNVRVELVTGGMDSTAQSVSLTQLPHIIVATPGRLADLLRSTDLRLNKVKFFVMDEADRLLDREDGDFTADLGEIMEKLPPREKRQTLMFSATLSETITEARSCATQEPFFWWVWKKLSVQKLIIKLRQSTELNEKSGDQVIMPAKLSQKYVMVPEDVRDSYLAGIEFNWTRPCSRAFSIFQSVNPLKVHLIKLLLEEQLGEKEQIVVFSKTCKSVQVLGMLLQKIGARACVLHSILKQKQRFAALEQFKSRRAR